MIDEILLSDEDFTIHLFCRVDDKMKNIPKHAQANLYPSEVATLALLFFRQIFRQFDMDVVHCESVWQMAYFWILNKRKTRNWNRFQFLVFP